MITGRICNTCEVIVAKTFKNQYQYQQYYQWDELTFKIFMTFAALVRIHGIVYSSQYERLQALEKISQKKRIPFLKVSIFSIHLGHFIKKKIANISNMGF